MVADTELIQRIQRVLAGVGDPERAVAQQRYMKSALPFFGIASPLLRSTLRPILSEHRIAARNRWEATVRLLWDSADHRELRYAALELLGHRYYRAWRDLELAPLLEHLIRTGAWWDLVDAIATHRVRELLLAHPEPMSELLRRWSTDPDLWVRRTAIIAQVGAKDRTDVELLSDCIAPSIDDRDFFARKAIGWALRDFSKTDPQWVFGYVADHPTLSGLSRREALKHLGRGVDL